MSLARWSGPFRLSYPRNARLEDVAREMVWPILPETFRCTGAPITTSLNPSPASLFPLPAWSLFPPPSSRLPLLRLCLRLPVPAVV
eukprot:257871-Pyramimonas_sp.AAC.1